MRLVAVLIALSVGACDGSDKHRDARPLDPDAAVDASEEPQAEAGASPTPVPEASPSVFDASVEDAAPDVYDAPEAAPAAPEPVPEAGPDVADVVVETAPPPLPPLVCPVVDAGLDASDSGDAEAGPPPLPADVPLDCDTMVSRLTYSNGILTMNASDLVPVGAVYTFSGPGIDSEGSGVASGSTLTFDVDADSNAPLPSLGALELHSVWIDACGIQFRWDSWRSPFTLGINLADDTVSCFVLP